MVNKFHKNDELILKLKTNNTHVQNLARKCPRSYLDYFMEQI